MKKGGSSRLTRKQKAELDALEALPDDQIQTGEIPEVRDWSGATRGLFYRPVKQQLTLRLDADVVAWFKRNAPGGAAIRPISTARYANTSSNGTNRRADYFISWERCFLTF